MKKDWSKITEEELEKLPFMKAQVHRIMKELGINGTEFSRLCNRTPSYFTSITGEIDTGTIRNLMSNLPKLNINWFITGKGGMFIDDASNSLMLEKQKNASEETIILSLYNDLLEKYHELVKENAKTEYENTLLKKEIENLKK